jgi:hypothetical protein
MSCPLKIVSPGVLEIKGSYSLSTVTYVRSEMIQGFVVNNRSNTIDILFVSGFPNKIIDCTTEQLGQAVQVMLDLTSLKVVKPSAIVAMQDTLSTSMTDMRRLLTFLEDSKIDTRLAAAEKEVLDIKKYISSLDTPMDVDPDEELEADAEEQAEEQAEQTVEPEKESEPEKEPPTKPDESDHEFDLMILCVSGVSVLMGLILGLALGSPYT